MKALLIAIFTLLSVVALGQDGPQRTYVGSNRELNTRYGGYQVDRFFRPPMSFEPWANNDSMGMVWFDSVNTKLLYYHNGTNRIAIVSGEGDSITFVTQYQFDTAKTNIYAAIAAIGSTDSSVFFTVYRADTMRSNLYAALLGKLNVADSGTAYVTPTGLNTAVEQVQSDFMDSLDWYLRKSDTASLVATYYRLYKSIDSIAALIPSLSGYVPYTGATGNVDLGDHSLTADRLNADTLEPNNSSGIHLHDKSHNDIFIAAAGGGNNLTIYAPTIFSLMANQSETDTVLGTSSTGLIKKIGIASTYLKKTDTATLLATQPWVISQGYSTTTGTVTSVSAGWGTNFTTITTTGSVTVDSNNVASKAYRQKGIDSVVGIGYITQSDLIRPITTTNFTTSVTIDADSYNWVTITAQAGALLFNAPSGTPTEGQLLIVRIEDDGTNRALTYNAIFRGGTLTLPSTTTTGQVLKMQFVYDATDSKWDLTGFTENY